MAVVWMVVRMGGPGEETGAEVVEDEKTPGRCAAAASRCSFGGGALTRGLGSLRPRMTLLVAPVPRAGGGWSGPAQG